MKLTEKEKGTIIFALEQYADLAENAESYQLKNSILEIIWKVMQGE